MGVIARKKRRRSRRLDVIRKPRGGIGPRVRKVGPEHFGIVSVDCAKARSKWMLADFYGQLLVAPEIVEHNRTSFTAAIARLRQAVATHDLRDVLVAVERTGRYHHAPKRAFAAAGFEARTVHPFTTKQFRQAADPGVKTDDTDLAAIHRATVNGFALIDPRLEASGWRLRLRVRHRRDLVGKTSKLCCQIKEHLDAAMPGYAACFPTMWDHPAALRLAWKLGSAPAVCEAGVAGMAALLRADSVRFQRRTLDRVMQWAVNAAEPDVAADVQGHIAMSLDEDRVGKERQIQALEREIASSLVGTPYVLLLSIPGINVVSAAEYAAEMGPISNYANSRCITGRAGLYPSRYQSDQVDRADGPLVRAANHRLRFAILQIAGNLIRCNAYFGRLAARWEAAGKDPRDNRVRVGQRFCRISFHMVAGRQVFAHPAVRGRDAVLEKLVMFSLKHQTPPPEMLADLHAATEQLPPGAHGPEADVLADRFPATRRGRGPKRLARILAPMLALLAGRTVQSEQSGAGGPM